MSSLLLAVALMAAVPVPGGGGAPPLKDDYLGKPIAQVIIHVEGRPAPEPALTALIETKPGLPLSMEDVRETMEHFISLGRFQDVEVDAALSGDSVILTYNVIPLHSVERLQFRGNLGLSERRLRQAVAQRHGALPPVGRAADAARTLRSLYQSYGYFLASVTPSAEIEHAPERATLVFTIDAGARAQVREITVTDTSVIPRERVLDRVELAEGRPLDEPALRRGAARLTDDFRRRGYYEASVTPRVDVREPETLADITVAIRPGPHVEVRFEGDPLPEDKRADLVPIAREGSVDADLLEDSERRILDYLRAQGHWKANVTHRREPRDGALEIVFVIRAGPVYRVGKIEVAGNRTVPPTALAPLRSKPGDLFVEAVLDADHAVIAEQYRKLGYADVKVNDAISEAAPGLVDVRLAITEGSRTLVSAVHIDGEGDVSEETLRASMGLAPGRAFYQPQLAADREAVLVEFLNRGYPDAVVNSETKFSADRSTVDVTYKLEPGAQVFVGHILIVGNQRTETKYIQRELALKPGAPLGLDDVVESQRRVTAMGLFRRVRITELRRGGRTRDVLVSVEEAPPTSIGYGGGLEGGRRLRRAEGGGAVERLEFAPRGFFEVGRRNLWGKNRSIDLFTRISLRPSDNADEPARDGRGFGFSEYRVLGTFHEPRAFGWTAEALVTAFVEQAIRSSFNLIRQGVNAELVRRLTPEITMASRYTFDRNKLFDERFTDCPASAPPDCVPDKPIVDRLFPQVRLSSFSSGLVRDTRDDALDPTKGALLGFEGELAARRIASEVGFAKTFVQGFAYRRLPGARGVVLAGGARLGLATGFRRVTTRISDTGAVIRGPDGNPQTVILRDLPASERWFAGGDTTVRGFALDRLGDPTKIGEEATIDSNGFPKGGNALFILNAEVRAPVWRDLGLVAFIDGGNVFAKTSHFDLGNLRGGAGFGIRYRSPVGPIRVDLGFKLDRRRFVSGERERLTALHISIGQAF
jgi:outer membrane protein insertion porin family